MMPQNRTLKEEKVQDSYLMKTGRKMAKIFIGPNLNARNQQKEYHFYFETAFKSTNIVQQSVTYAQITKNMRIKAHNIPRIMHLMRPNKGEKAQCLHAGITGSIYTYLSMLGAVADCVSTLDFWQRICCLASALNQSFVWNSQ